MFYKNSLLGEGAPSSCYTTRSQSCIMIVLRCHVQPVCNSVYHRLLHAALTQAIVNRTRFWIVRSPPSSGCCAARPLAEPCWKCCRYTFESNLGHSTSCFFIHTYLEMVSWMIQLEMIHSCPSRGFQEPIDSAWDIKTSRDDAHAKQFETPLFRRHYHSTPHWTNRCYLYLAE